MLTKLLGAVAFIVTATLVMLAIIPREASAWIILKSKSIDAELEFGAGGSPDSDQFLLFAVDIREIGGFCKNPAGGTEPAKGKPFQLHGFAVKLAGSDDFVQVGNGKIKVTLSVTNPNIQRAFDIYTYDTAKNKTNVKYVNLQTSSAGCPNPQWTWSGFAVTKVDAVYTRAKVPSLCSKPPCKGENVTHSGTAEYLKTRCRTAVVPELNDDGTYKTNSDGSRILIEVETCDFAGSPFTYCSRFSDTLGPDGKWADSGLRIYDYNDGVTHTGQMVAVNDHTYNVQDCYLWRDVNKLAAYNLSTFGTYDPDTASILSPQQGTNDVGGLVLRPPFEIYTGQCHQHGKENTGGNGTYSWDQKGPQKKICDGANLIAGDPVCTGGSQLLDGGTDGEYTLTCP